MPTPTVTEFWELLAKSGLVDAGRIPALQEEHRAAFAGKGPQDAPHVAHWLYSTGVLTRWQAKRLSKGNLGPFFFGDYRLLERHEQDGDHLVFTARHEPSGRIVIVVMLSATRCKRLDIWTEIVRQTTVANATTNPMLSRTWSLEQHQGTRFLVCEAVEGMNLADEVEQFGPLPAARAGVLVSQLAEAVAEIHAKGSVHGGLSLDAMRREPSPGGVERTGRVRLLQFPLAGDPHRVPLRPWHTDEAMRQLGRRAAYVAPELLHPEVACDPRADVYAIGAILYTLLTGTPPCWEGDAEKTLRKAAFEGPRALGPPQVSLELATLVAYLMDRDPARRYQHGGEAAAAIATCLGFAGGSRPVSQSLPEGQATPPTAPTAGSPTGAESPIFVPDDSVRFGPTLATSSMAPPSSSSPASPRAGDSPVIRARRRRAMLVQILGGGITVAILAGVVALVLSRIDFSTPEPPAYSPPRTVARNDASEKASNDRPGEKSVADSAGSSNEPAADPGPAEQTPPTPAANARQIVVDDDTLPWASPTQGPRPQLAFLPPGSQLVLVARPADLAADDEGKLFLQSLGPVAEAALNQLASFCGCQVSDIEMVQGGWQAGEADEVLAGYAVRLVDGRTVAADDDARRRAWGATTPRDVDGETIHAGKDYSFWVPSAAAGRVLVVASEAAIATGVPGGGDGAVPREPFIASIVRQSRAAHDRPEGALKADLPLELEALVGMLDDDRHVTLFGSPHYLLNRGRVVLAGPLAKLADPLRNLLGETIRGAALSAHFSGNTYVELDAIAARDPPARVFAPKLAEEVEALAGAVEAYCAMLDPSPYGRVLVMRLPAMLRTLVANMRVGVEGNGVVINAYLPRHAGHNIALAAELALSQTPGALASVAVGPAPPAAATDALGKLQKKITIVFAKDTLEMAIQMVSEEVGVPMEILGPDLQLDGITQNQSFGLDARDQTADEVLRVILGKANPDGKLVYIVWKTDGVEKILITTRAAVEKRGDTLPPAFQTNAQTEMKKP
jgi:serine/threonine protein kinase